MGRLKKLAVACAALVVAHAVSIAEDPQRPAPKKVGQREVIVEFTVDENQKPIEIISTKSDAEGLIPTAHALIEKGKIKPGAPGVELIKNRLYRATVSFPVTGDQAPLAADTALPKVILNHSLPKYPASLVKDATAGGALLKLYIDEKARLAKTELVRASHPQFGDAALEAVSKWTIEKPPLLGKKQAAVALFLLIVFEVDGGKSAPWQWQVSPEPALPIIQVLGHEQPTQK